MKAPIRYYSELDFPRPEHDNYIVIDGVPHIALRDTRMWMSVEWAKERGIPVPENWRDFE